MPPEREEDRIERLRRTLYSRNEKFIPRDIKTPIEKKEYDVPTNWGGEHNYDIKPEMVVKRNNSFFNKFLVGSVAFFVIAVAVALFIFFGGVNMISSNNLNVEVVAPTSISSGEELSIGLSVVNANRTDIEDVKLFIDYPLGSYTISESEEEVSHEEIPLGVIEKGGRVDHVVRTRIFGEKDTIKSFVFRVEYKVKGSNAVFPKEKTYDVVIGSSPILLEVKYPKEVNSGQDISMSLEVTSNSSVPIKDVLIKVEYPYGFTYKSANIKPVRDNSVWSIGDLKNGDIKKIDIVGSLVGQNLEDRSFRISAGTKTGSVYDFDTTLVSSLITMGIRKSFFDLTLSAYNNAVSKTGESTFVTIRWQNTLPDKIVDNNIEVKLSGNALNRNEVAPSDKGFFRSVDDTVLWGKNSVDALNEISPGDSNQVRLSVGALANFVTPSIIKNPHIDLRVKMFGQRSGIDGGQVESIENLTIKIASLATLTSKSFRAVGPFSNSGPIPPKADSETTYTINWLITNTTNDLKETTIRASLPQGVVWKGEISPQTEKISYDPDTRIVTWNVGNLSSGTGFTSSPKQVYFKVGITPSVNQVGVAPTIVSQANLSATDTYTESKIEANALNVSTKFFDPTFSGNQDIVVP